MNSQTMNNLIQQSIELGNKDNYELIRRIGCGRYGEVFEAFNVTNNKRCAVKVLKPVRREKVLREINVLRRLENGPNIITLKDVLISNEIPSLVFSYVSGETLKSLAMNLSKDEIYLYLFKLLKAIDFAHKNNIIHRDVKPSNVVIDTSRKVLRLIDWGLADIHTDDKSYSVTVASRFYKSPELLLNNTKYDYSLDIWSFGCIVAGLIFRKEPFFMGLDNRDQLNVICNVLGHKCLNDYIRKYELKNLPPIKNLLNGRPKPRAWKQFIVPGFESLANDISLDFVDKLLVFDHKFRLTAEEALVHPFFDCLQSNVFSQFH